MRGVKQFSYCLSAALLNGCVSQYEIFYDSIKWDPEELSTAECPLLTGKYAGDRRFFTSVLPMTKDEAPFVRAPKYGGQLIPRSKLILERPYPVQRELARNSSTEDKTIEKGIAPARISRRIYEKELEQFFSTAFIKIEQLPSLITVSLLSGNTIYRKVQLDLGQSGVGCMDGVLYIRFADASGGSEGGLGIAGMSERRLVKLADGEIQFDEIMQAWSFSPWTGIVGNSTDKRQTIIFDPVTL